MIDARVNMSLPVSPKTLEVAKGLHNLSNFCSTALQQVGSAIYSVYSSKIHLRAQIPNLIHKVREYVTDHRSVYRLNVPKRFSLVTVCKEHLYNITHMEKLFGILIIHCGMFRSHILE